MTNGEKIKEIFPNIVVNECAITIHATTKVECCSEKHCKGSISYDFWKEWWNAEYKEPTTKNDHHKQNIEAFAHDFGVSEEQAEKELRVTTKNNLGVDCIDRAELLKAMDTWDKFGYTETGCFVRAPKNDCVPYVHYNDMVNCVKGMPSVTPQEPRKGHWISHIEHCKQNNLLPSGLGSYFWCSECDCGIDSKIFYWVNYNYCPNCGAKMFEPQESEE